MRKPVLGDTVYCISDDVYYNDHQMPASELKILTGKIISIIHGGYTVYECVFNDAGPNNLRYPQMKDFGRRFFFDAESAVSAADNIADEWDRNWSRIMHEKMRRSYREAASL